MNHAIRAFHAFASPAFAEIMDDARPAPIRLSQIADQLHGAVEADLTLTTFDVRALVFALHDIADKWPEPQPVKRSWLGRVFG